MRTTWGRGLASLRVSFAEKISARLFTAVTAGPMTRPGRDAATWAAAAVAAVVHLFTLGLVVLAGLLLVNAKAGFPLIPIVAAIALVGLAFLMRPRLGRLHRDAEVVDRETAPELYGLADRVADALGARRVWRIVLSPQYNASYEQVGLRRRPVLTIGYPLWNVLTAQERVAVLGHELGHGVNGDSRRGLLVGSSYTSLAELYRTLRTDPGDSGDTLAAVGSTLARAATFVLSLPVLGLLLAQDRLLGQAGQRAEYFADHLAADLAGVEATRSALAKLRFSGGVVRNLRTAVLRRDHDVWAASRTWLATAEPDPRPEQPHRVDAGHPRTELRVDALAARQYGPAKVISTRHDAAAMDRELEPHLREIVSALRG
ncbi:M48 family metallopeptidase [Actinokineospora sp. NBRC 105648]|uniref:M48 family metallopeptidase n=1 Tax=Actinokineospora sp. NBRC 105648 TaxID=3032206 RepID=UPI0024A519F9|nr:M48 family metallopeptidase [Actinokineospora sp. NBRC 105648]GLZ43684.1 hypothetical protein Acsp05_73080 [Actinokineospora sp. NBRC 105648]